MSFSRVHVCWVSWYVPQLLYFNVNVQYTSFFQAGLDSLGSVELRTSLNSAFQIELPATVVFDYPTTAALAKCIVSQEPSTASPDSQVRHISLNAWPLKKSLTGEYPVRFVQGIVFENIVTAQHFPTEIKCKIL